jgi:flagellar basal body-associated protein FliL
MKKLTTLNILLLVIIAVYLISFAWNSSGLTGAQEKEKIYDNPLSFYSQEKLLPINYNGSDTQPCGPGSGGGRT